MEILLITAASIGFFHTLFGPDHYLPFIVMAKARKWSVVKTTWVTFLCGLGHVGSSILLGSIGVAFGIGVNKLVFIESGRGNIAAWLFIAFGLVYFIWGMRKAYRKKSHKHIHVHSDGTYHSHDHSHEDRHLHVHEQPKKKNITPWVLFVIFVLGPCEPLIPILMYPAATNNISGMILVSIVFAVVTITTMLGIVLASSFGLNYLPLGRLERFTHAIAGATILLSGIGIQFLGL
ncbi:MAG: sulfite exporter TauE/SafE family protein [Bacteroidales bacterium]|nr:sulfite exporter TauE/SafE family protein [Bacteroidales bacterium]